eukprot:gb/GECG01009373.1/.p1 GENE.gb/GECG01009373.1/~~gb/GECG01009373.1/.p1  ORF type:complete len:410 (+),score=39.58 gb/GECG01009373.1/:1-1230(+)
MKVVRRQKQNGGVVDIYVMDVWEVQEKWPQIREKLRAHVPDDVGIPISRRSAFLQFGLDARRIRPNAFQEPAKPQWPGIMPLIEKCISKPLILVLQDPVIAGSSHEQQGPWDELKQFVFENEGVELVTIGRSWYVENQRLPWWERAPVLRWIVWTKEGRRCVYALVRGSYADLGKSLRDFADRVHCTFTAEAISLEDSLCPMKEDVNVEQDTIDAFRHFLHNLANLMHPPQGAPGAIILSEEEMNRRKKQQERDRTSFTVLKQNYQQFREFQAYLALSASKQRYEERSKIVTCSIHELPGMHSVAVLPPALASGVWRNWESSDYYSTLPLSEVPSSDALHSCVRGCAIGSFALLNLAVLRRFKTLRYATLCTFAASGLLAYNTWANYRSFCAEVRTNLARAADAKRSNT